MTTNKVKTYFIGQHPVTQTFHIVRHKNPVCGHDNEIFERNACHIFNRFAPMHWDRQTILCEKCWPRGLPYGAPADKDLRLRAEALLVIQPPRLYSLFHYDVAENTEHFLATDTLSHLSERFFQKKALTAREIFDIDLIVTFAGDVRGIYRTRRNKTQEWLIRFPSDYRAPDDLRGSGRIEAENRSKYWAETAPERTKIENFQ